MRYLTLLCLKIKYYLFYSAILILNFSDSTILFNMYQQFDTYCIHYNYSINFILFRIIIYHPNLTIFLIIFILYNQRIGSQKIYLIS
jgi:hypothetical protein